MISKSKHRQPADAPQDQEAGRPRELQDGLNFYVFHPMARRLALLLARTPVTPNMVSIAGGLLVVAAGLAYAQPGWPLPALAGLALHLAWHVADGADGDLARLTARSSPKGELIDGICDYASHVVLYLILGALLQNQIGPFAWLFAVGAGVSRILQANHYEVQRRQYQWWMYGTPWLRSTRREATSEGPARLLGTAYLMLAQKVASHALAPDAAISEAQAGPGGPEQSRMIISRHAKPMLSSLSPLSANYRTLVLGLSMLAGTPLYFFLFEVVLLNLLLFRSIRICRRSTFHMIAELDQAAASTRR